MTDREKEIDTAIKLVEEILREYKLRMGTREGVPIVIYDETQKIAYVLHAKGKN